MIRSGRSSIRLSQRPGGATSLASLVGHDQRQSTTWKGAKAKQYGRQLRSNNLTRKSIRSFRLRESPRWRQRRKEFGSPNTRWTSLSTPGGWNSPVSEKDNRNATTFEAEGSEDVRMRFAHNSSHCRN